MLLRLSLSLVVLCLFSGAATADTCVDCHIKLTPGIVADWQLSKHSQNEISCDACHGSGHQSAGDVANVLLPTPKTCAQCHDTQVQQFSKGKHAAAWAAMNAMPTIHWMPADLSDGQKGCGGCHDIGLKSDAEIAHLNEVNGGHGNASCDACHTRHAFSLEEARSPQSCQTCHMGFDHPQWEMYSSSKHGVRNELKQKGILPETAAAPTCQTCHMMDGNHEVRTAWGFLAVRLPMPEDPEWTADRVTILQALGVLDPAGNPTARLDVVKAADVARLDEESFQAERSKMLTACGQCHSPEFAKGELEKGDEMIKHADHLMAEAIRIVASLYQNGTLAKPESYAYPFPDLLTFFDAPTPIEQKLHVMFLKHRMRTFQGTFHANPDYAIWYGWQEMKLDLAEIKDLAKEIERNN